MSKGAKVALIIVGIVVGLIVLGGVACAFCAKAGFEQFQKMAATGQNLGAVEAAVEEFHTDVGRYPTQAEGFQALLTAPPEAAQQWQGPYIADEAKLKDGWGNDLVYKAPTAEGQRPNVYSKGFNGVDDGGPGAGGDDMGTGNIQIDVETD